MPASLIREGQGEASNHLMGGGEGDGHRVGAFPADMGQDSPLQQGTEEVEIPVPHSGQDDLARVRQAGGVVLSEVQRGGDVGGAGQPKAVGQSGECAQAQLRLEEALAAYDRLGPVNVSGDPPALL